MASNPEVGVHSATSLARQIRLLALMDAAASAGLTPLSARNIHSIVYISDALAPLWQLSPLTPEVLKQFGGPYDADLQRDLDSLVGTGLIAVDDVRYEWSHQSGWRVLASYTASELSEPLLQEIAVFPDEANIASILREICLAIAALPEASVGATLAGDVTYADAYLGPNTLVVLLDDRNANQSSRLAERFREVVPPERSLGPAELANLYVRHLYRAVGETA